MNEPSVFAMIRSSSKILDCAGKQLDLTRPRIMGVLNITPDSFSDGGVFFAPEQAAARAVQMVEEGVAIIDVGGESTRPGSVPVSVAEELRRVIPVIEALHEAVTVPVSIDTRKPEVMQADWDDSEPSSGSGGSSARDSDEQPDSKIGAPAGQH